MKGGGGGQNFPLGGGGWGGGGGIVDGGMGILLGEYGSGGWGTISPAPLERDIGGNICTKRFSQIP